MKKLINPTAHGYIDYLYDVVLILAPSIFGFSPIATSLCYTLAAVHVVMSLITNYPLGVVAWIPFPVHGTIELVAAIGLVASPWIFNFMDDISGRNFFLIAGVSLFGVWLTTDYENNRRTAISSQDLPFRHAG